MTGWPAAGQRPRHGGHRAGPPRTRAARSCRSLEGRTWSWSRSRRTRPPPSAWPPRSCTERDPDTIMGSFAADQVIGPVEEFQDAVRGGRGNGGHRQDRDHRHQAHAPGDRVRVHPAGRGAVRARARPTPRAWPRSWRSPPRTWPRSTWTSGEYLWNAGMFVAPVSLMLKHLEANEPELLCRSDGDRPRPGTPMPGRDHGPGLARPAEDRDRLRGGRAGRRRRRRGRDPRRVHAGTTWATSPPSPG